MRGRALLRISLKVLRGFRLAGHRCLRSGYNRANKYQSMGGITNTFLLIGGRRSSDSVKNHGKFQTLK